MRRFRLFLSASITLVLLTLAFPVEKIDRLSLPNPINGSFYVYTKEEIDLLVHHQDEKIAQLSARIKLLEESAAGRKGPLPKEHNSGSHMEKH